VRPSPIINEDSEPDYIKESKNVTICSRCFELKKYPSIFDASSFEQIKFAELL